MSRGSLFVFAFGVVMLFPIPGKAETAQWPEMRGPTADGHAQVQSVPVEWSEQKNVRWKTPLHDKGWSTPVVWGDQIWLTTAREDGKQMFVMCLDRESGEIILDRKLFDVPNPRPLGNNLNCYASPSPVIEPGRVYVHFGSYGTCAIDTQSFGVLWQRRDLPCNHFRGPASSPVLYNNLLILHMDGSDFQYVVALNKETGKTVWKTDRSTDYGDLGPDGKPKADGDYRKAYNTPFIINVANQDQLISPGAKAVYSYMPVTGQESWQVRYAGHSTSARSLFDGRHVYIYSGQGQVEVMAVDPTGQGDVTDTHVVWRQRKVAPKRSSGILHKGLIYGCTDKGVASCLNSESGEIVWQHRVGGDFSASLLFAANHIYLCNQNGETVVIKPGAEFQQLTRNWLDHGCMSSPIAVDSAIYLRTMEHLYCLMKSREI